MKPFPKRRLEFTGLTLKAGHYYRNGLGDKRGPMRQVGDTFIDEYGGVYRANGHQHSHHIESAGNLKTEVAPDNTDISSESAMDDKQNIRRLAAALRDAIQEIDFLEFRLHGGIPEKRPAAHDTAYALLVELGEAGPDAERGAPKPVGKS